MRANESRISAGTAVTERLCVYFHMAGPVTHSGARSARKMSLTKAQRHEEIMEMCQFEAAENSLCVFATLCEKKPQTEIHKLASRRHLQELTWQRSPSRLNFGFTACLVV